MKCYAFDVDHTLEFSNGPVTLKMVESLKYKPGDCEPWPMSDMVGLCGNWGHITFNGLMDPVTFADLFSFFGPMTMPKDEFLRQISTWFPTFDEYVMVGNDNRLPGKEHMSVDAVAAELAGWRFISEDDFAGGER